MSKKVISNFFFNINEIDIFFVILTYACEIANDRDSAGISRMLNRTSAIAVQ